MKSAAIALWVGMPICLASSLQAQSIPQARDGSVITCNERFVYVLRGDTLLQFDATTLELKGKKSLTRTRKARSVVTSPEPKVRPAEVALPQNSSVEDSVARGLAWLASHQESNGSWDADGFMNREKGKRSDGPGKPTHDVGITALATLAILGDGTTMNKGKHRETLLKAVHWLGSQQDPDTGLIGSNASHTFIYDHAIATLALIEAYGLSDAKRLMPSAQRAINYLEHHRNPYAVWRYQPRDNDNDTSVTTWCLLAYLAAKDHGLEVNPVAFKLVRAWYDQMTDPVSGRTGYSERGGRPARQAGQHAKRFPCELDESMTAMALAGRLLMEQDPDHSNQKMQANLLLKSRPVWDVDGGRINAVGWYFGTQAMYQMGGRYWKNWNRPLTRALLTGQRRDGNASGSWDPAGVWGEVGGRVYSTALHTLTLQIANRAKRLVR